MGIASSGRVSAESPGPFSGASSGAGGVGTLGLDRRRGLRGKRLPGRLARRGGEDRSEGPAPEGRPALRRRPRGDEEPEPGPDAVGERLLESRAEARHGIRVEDDEVETVLDGERFGCVGGADE